MTFLGYRSRTLGSVLGRGIGPTALGLWQASRPDAGDPASEAGDTANAAGTLFADGPPSSGGARPGRRRGLTGDGGPGGVGRPGGVGGPDSSVTISQSFLVTAMSRETPALSVSVKVLGPDGRPSAEHTFLGVLTPQARNSDVTATPVLRQVVRDVFDTLGATPDSYTGQRAMELLATYPRAELFWASRGQILDVVSGQLQLASRRRLRVFLQPDPYGRFMSVLVYLPRDRYTTDRRLAMQQVLLDALGGTDIRYTARIGDSLLAAVHFTVTTDPERPVAVDRARRSPRDSARPSAPGRTDWSPRWSAVTRIWTPPTALSRYGDAFDEAYKEDYSVEDAVVRPATSGRAERTRRPGLGDHRVRGWRPG